MGYSNNTKPTIFRIVRGDYARYWWGQTTSAFGSVFTSIALPVVAVIYLGASPGQVSLISAAAVFPALAFGLPAGALADRLTHPRRTLMALDGVSALAVGVVAVGLATHSASLGWLVALGFIGGCVSILIEVVYFVHLRQLTGGDNVGRARARLQAGEYAAGFAGRLLAGPTIVVFGPAAALTVDAVSYVLSAVALLSMSPISPLPREPSSGPVATLGGIVAGLRVLARSNFHRLLLLFIVTPVAASAGVGALTGPFLLRAIHVPTSVYGVAAGLSGLMGLAGALVSSRLLTPERNPRILTLITYCATAACGLVLPLAAGPLPLAIFIVSLGIGLPVFFGAIANVCIVTAFTVDIPETTVGRAMAAIQVLASAAALAGALTGGALADWIGIRGALWMLNSASIAAIALLLFPAIGAARRSTGQTSEFAEPLASNSSSII